MKRISQACLILTALWLAPLMCGAAMGSEKSESIVHQGFEGFRGGTFGDSGANAYVSARGGVQIIHRWDLNRDGELDLVFTQDHNYHYGALVMVPNHYSPSCRNIDPTMIG